MRIGGELLRRRAAGFALRLPADVDGGRVRLLRGRGDSSDGADVLRSRRGDRGDGRRAGGRPGVCDGPEREHGQPQPA